jgi:hypothetical protein
MKIRGEVEVQLHNSSPRHWMETSVQLHAPAALPSEERAPSTYCIGGWVDPTTGLDDLEKRKFLTLPGLELRHPRSPSQ